MQQREDTERRANSTDAPVRARKPYQKPAVRHERVFETSALGCGKVHPTNSNCRTNPNAS